MLNDECFMEMLMPYAYTIIQRYMPLSGQAVERKTRGGYLTDIHPIELCTSC